MNKLIFLVLISCPILIHAQSGRIIDSLLKNHCKEIIVLKEECLGCLTLNYPCEKYGEDGNFEDIYIFWRNNKKTYVTKTNVCGRSKDHEIKKWQKNPFDLVNAKRAALDTTLLKSPLSFNHKDSTWVETSLNHNQYYTLYFPAHHIKELRIDANDFKKIESKSQPDANVDIEWNKNIPRYIFNNNTAVKALLDILDAKLVSLRKKMKTK